MDISSLQVPGAGRSRFSKALPTPPGLEDRSQTALRELPNVPPAPPPPKKNSILITKPSIPSLRSKNLDSPLPVLPIMAEPARPRLQAGPITRKPVAQLPTPPPSVGDIKSKAMKRKSSISSLLSAYSRSSSDWAASHESDFTKDSEPSYSPEREGMDSLPPVPSKKSMETTNDTNSDRTSEVTSYTIIDSFPPPPPPLKDPSRPRTPRTGTSGPTDGIQDRNQARKRDSASSSPVSVRSGSSRAGPIWQRRASSKSDASLVITELKLPSSNGSTASTLHIPAGKAEPPSLPPPPPAKTSHQPALPLPLPPKQHQQSAATLPPRTVSLPGRNIRPTKQTETLNEDDEMKKLMKLSKLKELVRSHGGDDDGDEEQKRGEQHELQETQRSPDVNTDANKPEPPAKDNFTQKPQQRQANAPTTAAGGANPSPASPSDTAGPPPRESGMTTTAAIARRPVGAQPASNLNQAPRLELEFEKKNTNLPNLQQLSIQPASASHPKNPVGTLPHPSQRQPQQPSRGPPAHPNPRSGPTSPTGRTPRSVSASAHPNQPAAMAMAAIHPPPSVITMGSPRYQSHASQPMSPGVRPSTAKSNLPPHQLMGPPRAPNAPFPTQASAFGTELGTVQESGRGAGLSEDKETNDRSQLPMSDAAAAAVALFPRSHDWRPECTVDGVWQPNALNDRHYNCHLNHARFTNSRNTHYPLACQTCGIADKERRYLCTYCNLRICVPCVELLTTNGRSLRATMDILRRQGKIKEWNQYPKRSIDQNTEDNQSHAPSA